MRETFITLNRYKIMWVIVLFDLPVLTKEQRRKAATFRKELLKDGFVMMQFSVYARSCSSGESATVHENRVKVLVPEEGLVSMIRVTDKQFGDIINFVGRKRKKPMPGPVQLELF